MTLVAWRTQMDILFTSGEVVPYSGTYVVTHHPSHATEQAITLESGMKFPRCVDCTNASFMLVHLQDIGDLLSAPLEL
jgi:hypothetical protein